MFCHMFMWFVSISGNGSAVQFAMHFVLAIIESGVATFSIVMCRHRVALQFQLFPGMCMRVCVRVCVCMRVRACACACV